MLIYFWHIFYQQFLILLGNFISVNRQFSWAD